MVEYAEGKKGAEEEAAPYDTETLDCIHGVLCGVVKAHEAAENHGEEPDAHHRAYLPYALFPCQHDALFHEFGHGGGGEVGQKFHHVGQEPSYGTLVERNLFQVIFPCFLFLLFRFIAEGIKPAFHFPFAEPFQRQHRQSQEKEEGQGDGYGKSQHG